MSEKVKKPLYKRWWFIVIVVIVAIGVFSNLGGDGGAPASSDKANNNQEQKKEPEPEIFITSADLAKAFEDNEIKANGEYKDKLVEISGKVYDIGESLGSTYITMDSYDDFALVHVQCFYDDKAEIDKIANLNKGDDVVVIGKVDGKSLNVIVKKCKFK